MLRADEEDVRHVTQQRDVGHVAQRVERQGVVEAGIDGMGAGGSEQESVSVRPGAGDVFGGDIAAGACAVVHHHWHAEGLGKRLC